jgi:hypothetical protein
LNLTKFLFLLSFLTHLSSLLGLSVVTADRLPKPKSNRFPKSNEPVLTPSASGHSSVGLALTVKRRIRGRRHHRSRSD